MLVSCKLESNDLVYNSEVDWRLVFRTEMRKQQIMQEVDTFFNNKELSCFISDYDDLFGVYDMYAAKLNDFRQRYIGTSIDQEEISALSTLWLAEKAKRYPRKSLPIWVDPGLSKQEVETLVPVLRQFINTYVQSENGEVDKKLQLLGG